MKKRIVALLMALCLLVGLAPTIVATEMHYETVIIPQYEEVGRFNDGYAPVKEDKSLQGLLCMKIEVNGESKYYTFRTPHIEYPDQLAVHYRADK